MSLLAKEIEKLLLEEGACVKFVTDGPPLTNIVTDPARNPARINDLLGCNLEIVQYQGVDGFLNTLKQFDV